METFSALLTLCKVTLTVTLTKASDTELWYFLWSSSEQTFEQTIETLVIWDTIGLIYDVTVIILFQENSVNTIAAVLSVIILDLWHYKQHNIFDICFEWLYKKGVSAEWFIYNALG